MKKNYECGMIVEKPVPPDGYKGFATFGEALEAIKKANPGIPDELAYRKAREFFPHLVGKLNSARN
jgi:hypothetical protein